MHPLRFGFVALLLLVPKGMKGQESQSLPNPAGEAPADTSALEEVRITVMPLNEKFMESTGAVFTLRNDQIPREIALVSTRLFNSAPGVVMSSGALNTHRVVIRGVGSRTPYNSNRIRAYLDDIPLTTGDGISTLEDQDMLAVGSMEILKGPSSALYGSGLGGVIRLNSPYPQEAGWSTRILAETGSFGSRRYGLTGTLKKGSLAFTGGFTRTASGGFRENSDYLRHSAFLHARLFSRKNTLSLTLSLTDLHAGIPSSLNEEDFLQNPEKAGGNWGNTGGFEEYLKLLGGLKLESNPNERLSNKLILYTGYGDPYERRPFNVLDERSSHAGIRDFLEYRTRNFNMGIGAEYFHERFRWQTLETLQEGSGALISDQREKRSYVNGFGFVQWRPAPGILLDGGLNLNLLNYSISTIYRLDSTDQGGSYRYPPVLSPRLGISFLHGEHVRSYASAGHGFSAPSLEETLLPEGLVNTRLRPESGWNLDLGNRGLLAGGRLRYDLTLYSIFLDDLLVTERVAEDIFTGINAGSAWNRGLELFFSGKLHGEKNAGTANADAQISYHLSKNTFTAFVDDGVDYTGKQLPGIPRQVLRTLISGEFRGIHAEFQHVFTGKQWMDDANEKLYPGYHLNHLQLEWEHGLASSPVNFRAYAGIRNVFNTHHASMILINAPSFGGSAPRYYYPGTPRYFYLGLNLTLRSPVRQNTLP